MAVADDYFGAGRVHQSGALRFARESGSSDQQGNQINRSVKKELKHGRFWIFLRVRARMLCDRLLFGRERNEL